MNPLPEQYRNQVLQKDAMDILTDLPGNCINLVYADPDYNTGIKYRGRSYTMPWEQYVQWYIDLARQCLRILRPDGNLLLINMPKQNAYLRVRFLNQEAHGVHDYVWVYNTNIGQSKRRFTNAHRSILHVTKSADNRFHREQVLQPYQNPDHWRVQERLRQGSASRMPYSWMNFNMVKSTSGNKTQHPCQIPQALSRLLIQATTVPGDTALIPFGGSGSEVVEAHLWGLTYLARELDPHYCTIIRDRLENDGNVSPQHRHPAGGPRPQGKTKRQPRLLP